MAKQPQFPGSLMKRLCAGVANDYCTKIVYIGSYCDACQKAKNKAKNAKGAIRYNADFKRARADWAPVVATGSVKCARCPGLITVNDNPVTSTWALDHLDNGTLAPSHKFCNDRAGGRNNAKKKRSEEPWR